MQPIIECVPNFSEGRNLQTIKLITDAIETVEGIRLLDVDPGKATNRTVVTFVGAPADVIEAAFRGIQKAAEVIDIALMVEDNLTGRSVWQMRRELVSLRITDPTPHEIAERAAEIRREWTSEEHERRSSGRYSTWEMPTCNMEALTGVGGHGVSL